MAENPEARYLKRTKCFKLDDFGRKVLFRPDDFKPKNKFTVNNQEFEVVDADARTRKWFMETRGEVYTLPKPNILFVCVCVWCHIILNALYCMVC
jgi:hypothetical protein